MLLLIWGGKYSMGIIYLLIDADFGNTAQLTLLYSNGSILT